MPEALLVPFVSLVLPAQAPTAIPTLAQAPRIDHEASLADWQGARIIEDFHAYQPDDKAPLVVRTRAHVAFAADGLYLAIECFDPEPAKVRAFPVRRDAVGGNQDHVLIELDATGQGQTAISFQVNPLGIQGDSQATEGVWNGGNYDLLWDSAGTRTPTGYVVKVRIPFGSVRRRPGTWLLRLTRNYPRERGYMVVWPQQENGRNCDLCQLAPITGAPIQQGGNPFMFVPFLAANRQESAAEGTLGRPETTTRVGFDLRYARASLNLDATYQPDFNAVEADVDPLRINTRTKYQYPEKRPFYLEGTEAFSVSGAAQQFASRSIIDPLYGVKASGREGWGTWAFLQGQDRAGGTSLASDGLAEADGLATRDLAGVARLNLDQQGSNLTFLATDRLVLGGVGRTFNQTGGIYVDERLGKRFSVSASGIQSLTHRGSDGSTARGSATSLGASYSDGKWMSNLWRNATSPEFQPGMGFLGLAGLTNLGGNVGHSFRNGTSWWTGAGVFVGAGRTTWSDGSPFGRSTFMNAWLNTKGRISVSVFGIVTGREWYADREFDSRAGSLFLTYSGLPGLRFTLMRDWGSGPNYSTALPSHSRSLSLGASGNRGRLRFQANALQSDLLDDATGRRDLRARRLFLLGEWALPADTYLRLQHQIVRTYPFGGPVATRRYVQVLGGWQPNAFTQAYVGWSQGSASVSVYGPAGNVTENKEWVQDKGFFAKLAYALRW